MMQGAPEHIKKGIRVFTALIGVLIIFFGGVYVGYENRPAMAKVVDLVHKDAPITANTDFDSFWKAWEIVNTKLPDAEDTPPQERVYGAIKGMLASFGDPYTT